MKIKYFVMDVDGTLTDGKIYMGNKGELCKAFHVKDGIGIHDILIPKGVIPIILTGRTSDILYHRCKELGISELYQGIDNKMEKLNEILAINGDTYDSVAYIGDDINDLICMKKIKNSGGMVACPADAASSIIEVSNFVCSKRGGEGAVREFIEWIEQKEIEWKNPLK